MNFRSVSAFYTFAWLGLMAACSSEAPSTGKTQEESIKALERRLNKSENIKIRFEEVRDALEPLETVLGDLASAIDTRVSIDGKPATKALRMASRLRKLLRDASSGLVEIHSNDTWTLRGDFENGLTDTFNGCHKNEIVLEGKKAGDVEIITVSVQVCKDKRYNQILVLTVDKAEMNVSFSPEVFEDALTSVLPASTKIGACRVKVVSTFSELRCDSFKIAAGNASLSVEDTWIRKDATGLSLDLGLRLLDDKDSLVAWARAEVRPGSKLKLELRLAKDIESNLAALKTGRFGMKTFVGSTLSLKSTGNAVRALELGKPATPSNIADLEISSVELGVEAGKGFRAELTMTGGTAGTESRICVSRDGISFECAESAVKSADLSGDACREEQGLRESIRIDPANLVLSSVRFARFVEKTPGACKDFLNSRFSSFIDESRLSTNWATAKEKGLLEGITLETLVEASVEERHEGLALETK